MVAGGVAEEEQRGGFFGGEGLAGEAVGGVCVWVLWGHVSSRIKAGKGGGCRDVSS